MASHVEIELKNRNLRDVTIEIILLVHVLYQIIIFQVTLETFVQWKKRKLKEKADALKKESAKRKEKYKAGLSVGLSGREMFTFDPKMVGGEAEEDDEEGEAFDLSKMEREDGENESDGVKVHEIKFDEYGIMDDGLDDSTAVQLAKLKGSEGAGE